MATKEQEITQIGHSVTIKGDISGNSDVRVAGNINGSITIEGELIVERQGFVEGEIKTSLSSKALPNTKATSRPSVLSSRKVPYSRATAR